MRLLPRILITCLLFSGLAACANPLNISLPTATVTPRPETLPAATSEASVQGEAIMVGDVRFDSRSIPAEAGAVSAADLDGDGILDLVSAREPQLTTWHGDGKGGFTSTSRVPAGIQPDELDLADLDGDGDVDIVIANHDTDYLTIVLGDGRGAFQPAPNSPLRIDVRPHPHVVKAVDIDADGHLDLVVDDRDGEGLLILRGFGDGGFASPGTLVKVGGDPYRGMAIGDINGDGLLDIVTPNPREAGVLLNTSKDAIEFEQAAPVAVETPFAVGLGDFNGDGKLDLITGADEASPLVELYWGDGSGGFLPAEDSPLDFATGGKNIVVGDFNGDGIDDAAVASYHFTDVLVLLGDSGTLRTGYLPGGEHPWGLAAADLNGDGKDDLVIADEAAPRITVYLSMDP